MELDAIEKRPLPMVLSVSVYVGGGCEVVGGGMREKLAVTVLSESMVTDVLAELGLATPPDQLVN